MIGLAQGAFDATMPYLHQRKQFGQLIGDFQAMQEAFNRWEKQSGLDLTTISRTLSLSVDSPLNAAGRQ